MANGNNIVVPAELISQVKEGLIKLGYANESTDPAFVQDCYFKWVMINQTGFNPHMPYALCLLPKAIRDVLNVECGGGTVDPEPTDLLLRMPNPQDYLSLLDLIKSGAWVINSPFIGDPSTICGSESLDMRTVNGVLTVDVIDESEVEAITSDHVTLKSLVPVLIEIVGLDDASYNGMVDGSLPIEMYTKNGVDGEWNVLPKEYFPMMLVKYTPNGKYYFIIATNILSVATGSNPLNFFAIDKDGSEGTEYGKNSVNSTLTFGEVKGGSVGNNVKFKLPSAVELKTLFNQIENGNWGNAINSEMFNPNSLPILPKESFDLESSTINTGFYQIVPKLEEYFSLLDPDIQVEDGLLHLVNGVIPSIVKVENLTDDQASEFTSGTSTMSIYEVLNNTPNKLDVSTLANLLHKNPTDNAWYIVMPVTNVALDKSGLSLSRLAIDTTGTGYKPTLDKTSLNLVGDPEFTPSVPLPISIEYITASEIRNFNRLAGDGEILLPNLDHNDVLWYDKYVLEDTESGYLFKTSDFVDKDDFLSVYKGFFALVNNGKKLITSIFKLNGFTDAHINKLLAFNDPNVYFKMMDGANEIDVPEEIRPMMQNLFVKVGDLWYFAMPSINVVRDNVFPLIAYIDGVAYRPTENKPISIELASMTLGLSYANDVGDKHIAWGGFGNVLDPDNAQVGVHGYEAYYDLAVGAIAKIDLAEVWASTEDVIVDFFMCPIRPNSGDTTKENALHIGTASNLPSTGQSFKLEFTSVETGTNMLTINPLDVDAHFMRYLNFSINRTNYETSNDVIIRKGDRLLVVDYQSTERAKIGEDVSDTASLYYVGTEGIVGSEYQSIPETHTRLVVKVRTSSTQPTISFNGLELPPAQPQ